MLIIFTSLSRFLILAKNKVFENENVKMYKCDMCMASHISRQVDIVMKTNLNIPHMCKAILSGQVITVMAYANGVFVNGMHQCYICTAFHLPWRYLQIQPGADI